MTIADIKDLVAGIGFPAFVAIYLLIFNRTTMQRLTDAVNKLTSMVEKLCNKD